MMGPDCGTAIINGTGLCFANAVRRGPIGIIGASGTGSQELSVRIHEFGGGVSQLIGTGGRDLSEKIGGLMMLDAIAMLDADDATQVITLISKPPAPSVAEKVLARAAPAANRWWSVSSVVISRRLMKATCSSPWHQRGGAEGRAVNGGEKRVSRPGIR